MARTQIDAARKLHQYKIVYQVQIYKINVKDEEKYIRRSDMLCHSCNISVSVDSYQSVSSLKKAILSGKFFGSFSV
mgnify:CR=1 FL=1